MCWRDRRDVSWRTCSVCGTPYAALYLTDSCPNILRHGEIRAAREARERELANSTPAAQPSSK